MCVCARACLHASARGLTRVRRECVGSCLSALLNEVLGKTLTAQTT